jgi:hypothetical protein
MHSTRTVEENQEWLNMRHREATKRGAPTPTSTFTQGLRRSQAAKNDVKPKAGPISQSALSRSILEVLFNVGGSADGVDVLRGVEKLLVSKFSEHDVKLTGFGTHH